MKNLDLIAEELFNKIRGRFPSVTLGDGEGKVTNIPADARFFDFDYKEGEVNLGKVSISLSENSVEIMYSDSFVSEQDEITKQNWYNFLKEIRQFSKKRLMTFDTRNINKSNLDKRDYKFLAQNRGEETMSESKMYGTNRVSYQKVDGARIVVKHTESVNTELAGGRTRSIGKIYIESADGERFMYPFKHLSGARAMARHVAEGGKPFDEFGTHIVGLSEEMNKLRKFKSYMGRSAVMAESLAGYTSVVNDRIKLVKKTIESLQKPNYYAEAFGSFEVAVMEDVPADVKENWIDQLTIKQFNEELSDVFPYIYNLVSEATRAKELTAEDLLGEADDVFRADMKIQSNEVNTFESNFDNAFEEMMGQFGEADEEPRSEPNYAQQAKDQLSLNKKVQAASDKVSGDLSNGFQSATVDIAGTKGVPAVLDTQRNVYIVPNKGYVRSIAKFITIQNGKIDTSMSVGPETMKALQAAGLVEGLEESKDDDFEEGNAYANTVRQAKMNGKKKGDKVTGPDGDEITLEKEQKTPVTEYILSMFDRESGQFPKGETAILTAIEKDYGEQYINPAKAFIEAINAKYKELNLGPAIQEIEFDEPAAGTMMEPTVEQDDELSNIRRLSGI